MVDRFPMSPVGIHQVVLSPGVHRSPGVPQIRAGLHRHQRAGPVGERLPPPPARVARIGPRLAPAGGGARADLPARLHRGTVGDHARRAGRIGWCTRGSSGTLLVAGRRPGCCPGRPSSGRLSASRIRAGPPGCCGWRIIRGSSSRWGCCVPRRTGDRPSTSGSSGSFP